MLATLGGLLALPLGLIVLLLPLLAPELSRPRDAAWGAVVLLLGLDLVTSADRLTGAPMLGVLCGALLIGRLGQEVGQGRWRQLTDEERQRLGSLERWTTSFRQLGITSAGLVERAGAGIGNLTTGFGGLTGGGAGARMPTAAAGQGGGTPARSGGKRKGKRWVRPETPAESAAADAGQAPATAGPAGGDVAEVAAPQGSQEAAPGSFSAAPAPEPAEGPRSTSKLAGPSEPLAAALAEAAPARPSALLPAPGASESEQLPESAAPLGVAEPEPPSPAELPDPAAQPSSSRELESRA